MVDGREACPLLSADVPYYFFLSLKGICLFVVILLIGTGTAIVQPRKKETSTLQRLSNDNFPPPFFSNLTPTWECFFFLPSAPFVLSFMWLRLMAIADVHLSLFPQSPVLSFPTVSSLLLVFFWRGGGLSMVACRLVVPQAIPRGEGQAHPDGRPAAPSRGHSIFFREQESVGSMAPSFHQHSD